MEVGRNFIFAFEYLSLGFHFQVMRLGRKKPPQILLQFGCHNVLPGIIQAQRSSGPTKPLRQSFGGKDFIKNDQLAPFYFVQFLKDF